MRDQLNAQIKADAAAKANGLDDVIDIAAAVQDSALPNRWAAPGGVAQTADGTHPYPSACIAARRVGAGEAGGDAPLPWRRLGAPAAQPSGGLVAPPGA